MILTGLVDIACFDLIPVDLFYPTIFDFEDSDSFNAEMAAAGYDSGYLPENMGTVFVMTHFFAAIYLTIFLLLFCR